MGATEPLHPKNQPEARRTDDRRVMIQRCRSCSQDGGLPIGLRPGEDHSRYGGGCFEPSTGQSRRPSGDRQQYRQDAPFRGRWKRGAEAQAIGRSRGGRTTKIHAIVDAHERPIAIEVTPGHLGDVRVATACARSAALRRRIRHPLRQARSKLHRRHHVRSRRHLLDLIQSGA